MNPPRSVLSPRPARAGIRGRTLRTAGFAALAAACLLPAAPRAAPPPPDQAEVDRILDKISAQGIQSLTKAERQTLHRASRTF